MEGLEIIVCQTRSLPELVAVFIEQLKPYYEKGWTLSSWQILDELMQEAPSISTIASGQQALYKLYTMVGSVVEKDKKENPA